MRLRVEYPVVQADDMRFAKCEVKVFESFGHPEALLDCVSIFERLGQTVFRAIPYLHTIQSRR